jgi:hypothetical protein
VEVQVDVETLCLVRDRQGKSRLLSRRETLKDRITLQQFIPPVQRDQEPDYIMQLEDLSWDGEMVGRDLLVTFYLTYMVYGARQQVVEISKMEETDYIPAPDPPHNNLPEDDHPDIDKEMARMENENIILRRKVDFFEKDLLSLRRGIKKAENRNAFLNREVSQYQEMVKELREALERKDLVICQYQNQSPEESRPSAPVPAGGGEDYKIGQILKRMFLNGFLNTY